MSHHHDAHDVAERLYAAFTAGQAGPRTVVDRQLLHDAHSALLGQQRHVHDVETRHVRAARSVIDGLLAERRRTAHLAAIYADEINRRPDREFRRTVGQLVAEIRHRRARPRQAGRDGRLLTALLDGLDRAHTEHYPAPPARETA